MPVELFPINPQRDPNSQGQPRNQVEPKAAVPNKNPKVAHPMRHPLILKTLREQVKTCSYRVDTGTTSNASCCASEDGKVFRCEFYNVKPVNVSACVVCKRDEAIENGATWIQPLLELSQGLAQPSLSDIQKSLPDSEKPSDDSPIPS